MNRTTVALATVLLALAARPVSAQSIGIYNPPAQPFARQPVSPYLNLLRGGNPGINYFGLVRPQVQADRFIQQQELLAAQQQVQGPIVSGATGHATSFLRYRQYFLTQGGGGVPNAGPQTVTGGTAVATATTAQTLPQQRPTPNR